MGKLQAIDGTLCAANAASLTTFNMPTLTKLSGVRFIRLTRFVDYTFFKSFVEEEQIKKEDSSYQYEMYSAERQATVNVLIDMQPSFTDAQEIVDTLTSMGVTAKLIDDGCCLFEQDGDGMYALYGITGDAGENFAATLEYDDGTTATEDELKALRSEFWL